MSVIGIDFGTISNKISCYNKYGLRTLINNYKINSTPSVAFLIHKDKWIFGERAKKIGINKAKQFIFDTKMMLGKNFHDQEINKHWPFEITNDQNNIKIMIKIDNEIQKFYPYEIAGLILKDLLLISQVNGISSISRIIISAPIQYNEIQINDLKKAAELAEFQNFNIYSDPILASLAYLYCMKEDIKYFQNIIIYDLGSSHLDVSIIILKDDTYEMFTEKGDTIGKQFDDNLFNFVNKKMQEKYQNKIDFLNRPKTQSILHHKCEEAKLFLSEIDDIEIILDDDDDFLDENEDNQLIYNLKIAEFNEINRELFERSMIPLKKIMKKFHIEKESIHNLFLVGGSTFMKKIRELLFDTTKKVPCPLVDPRKAVSIGASIVGAWEVNNEMNIKEKLDEKQPFEFPTSFKKIIDILLTKRCEKAKENESTELDKNFTKEDGLLKEENLLKQKEENISFSNKVNKTKRYKLDEYDSCNTKDNDISLLNNVNKTNNCISNEYDTFEKKKDDNSIQDKVNKTKLYKRDEYDSCNTKDNDISLLNNIKKTNNCISNEYDILEKKKDDNSLQDKVNKTKRYKLDECDSCNTKDNDISLLDNVDKTNNCISNEYDTFEKKKDDKSLQDKVNKTKRYKQESNDLFEANLNIIPLKSNIDKTINYISNEYDSSGEENVDDSFQNKDTDEEDSLFEENASIKSNDVAYMSKLKKLFNFESDDSQSKPDDSINISSNTNRTNKSKNNYFTFKLNKNQSEQNFNDSYKNNFNKSKDKKHPSEQEKNMFLFQQLGIELLSSDDLSIETNNRKDSPINYQSKSKKNKTNDSKYKSKNIEESTNYYYPKKSIYSSNSQKEKENKYKDDKHFTKDMSKNRSNLPKNKKISLYVPSDEKEINQDLNNSHFKNYIYNTSKKNEQKESFFTKYDMCGFDRTKICRKKSIDSNNYQNKHHHNDSNSFNYGRKLRSNSVNKFSENQNERYFHKTPGNNFFNALNNNLYSYGIKNESPNSPGMYIKNKQKKEKFLYGEIEHKNRPSIYVLQQNDQLSYAEKIENTKSPGIYINNKQENKWLNYNMHTNHHMTKTDESSTYKSACKFDSKNKNVKTKPSYCSYNKNKYSSKNKSTNKMYDKLNSKCKDRQTFEPTFKKANRKKSIDFIYDSSSYSDLDDYDEYDIKFYLQSKNASSNAKRYHYWY